MKLNKLLKTQLYLILIISYQLSTLLGVAIADLFHLNVALGWKYDMIYHPISVVIGILPLLYFFVYMVLSFKKISTDVFYAKVHLFFFVISNVFMSFTIIKFELIILSCGISFLMFILNVSFSISKKNLKIDA